MAGLGPYLAGALLLIVAGAAKAWRPGDLATALAGALSLSTVTARRLVRLGAIAEAGLGAVAVAHPGPRPAAAIACSYLAFAGYVAWLRVRGGPLATCGCLGATDTPATGAHVVLDLAFAGAALAVATESGGWLPRVLESHPAGGGPLLLAAATTTVLALGVIGPLARVHGARLRFGDER